MALADLQAALARLYTDSGFRARFFADREAVCDELRVAARDREALRQVEVGQVERYARSLINKRLGVVRELLPATATALPEFDRLFSEYCESSSWSGKAVDDAMGFCAFAFERAVTGPPYLRDLVGCERLRLELLFCREPIPGAQPQLTDSARPSLTARARVQRFDYDLEALYPRLARGEAVEAVSDESFIVLGKVRGELRVKLLRINATTARLLELCDGSRTLSQLCSLLGDELNLADAERARFARACHANLDSLRRSDLLAME